MSRIIWGIEYSQERLKSYRDILGDFSWEILEQMWQLQEARTLGIDYKANPSTNDGDGLNHYYDRDRNPIDPCLFSMLHQNFQYKIVKQEQIGGYFLSTAWLGLDHALGFFPKDEIEIFETMLFAGDETVDSWRKGWEADALAIHETVSDHVRAEVNGKNK